MENVRRALVVLGTPLAILALWIARQALDTNEWTQTSSRLLENGTIQTAVAGYLVNELYANVNVAGELERALPPRLQPLAGPAAGALRTPAQDVARAALGAPVVQQTWKDANRRAHARLIEVLNGGGDVLSTGRGVVTLDLRALLSDIGRRTGILARIAAKLPPDAARIQALRSDQLRTAQVVAKLLRPLALLLILLALASYGVAMALVPGHRREMLRDAGIGCALAGIAALVARRIAGNVVVDSLAATAAVRPAVEATWSIGASVLVDTAVAAIAYGVLVVAGAWLAGPRRAAVALRRGLAPYLRDARLTYAAVAAIVLLVLLSRPTPAARRLAPAIGLIALFVVGVEALRRQVAREFPGAERRPWDLERARELLARARSRLPERTDREGAAAAGAAGRDAAVAQLERLAELHAAGDLDDEEFALAKRRVLVEATSP